MEGVYKVNKGNAVFGNRVVLKWSRNGLSIFGENQAIYVILDAGSLNNEIRMEGKYFSFYIEGSHSDLSTLFVTCCVR